MSKYKIIGVVAAALIAYLVWRLIKKNPVTKEEEKLKDSIDNTPVNTSNVTLKQQELDIMAAQLYDAMKGFGTKNEVIDSVFSRIKTKDDLNALAELPAAVRFSPDGRYCYLGYPFAGTLSVNTPTWKIKRIEFAESGDVYTTCVDGAKDTYSHVFALCDTYSYAFPR